MEINKINSIIENIDKSLDKQIRLMSQQLVELKNQIVAIEGLLYQLKSKNHIEK